jgi:hypothetical protein
MFKIFYINISKSIKKHKKYKFNIFLNKKIKTNSKTIKNTLTNRQNYLHRDK